ncbi:hypothetical protein PMI05_05521 [Brevibacillus sp. BC25]|nr:hypothetical protein PMI05_05521 [Brevibacillus sp. BC25]
MRTQFAPAHISPKQFHQIRGSLRKSYLSTVVDDVDPGEKLCASACSRSMKCLYTPFIIQGCLVFVKASNKLAADMGHLHFFALGETRRFT